MRPLLILCALLCASCSGLMYYPTRLLHFDPAKFGLKAEDVDFLSADGTKLFGWRFRARDPKAVIVFYHGNSGNISSQFFSMLWAPAKGYDVFAFDYRGYGRSQGSPDPEGTVSDGEAALRWAHAQYPKLPIVIYGQSLGGAIALRNAIDLRGELPLRAVVIEGSFPSYRGIGSDVLTRRWFTWPLQWFAHLALSDRYAPDGDIGRLAPVPLLVLHAENDPVVPHRFGEEIFWQAGEPRELWRIPGDGHVNALFIHGATYRDQLNGWLGKALGR